MGLCGEWDASSSVILIILSIFKIARSIPDRPRIASECNKELSVRRDCLKDTGKDYLLEKSKKTESNRTLKLLI
ncbi:hypothetical protein TNCV_1437821 [Trichonephila clavipes]|nr:hypothetical protein TNCV_1437821 [Trichonephila clavipes]